MGSRQGHHGHQVPPEVLEALLGEGAVERGRLEARELLPRRPLREPLRLIAEVGALGQVVGEVAAPREVEDAPLEGALER